MSRTVLVARGPTDLPRLVVWALLLLAALAALAACADVTVSQAPRKLALSQPELDPEAARRLINAYRAEKGLAPLALDAKLERAARAHSQDLARGDRIDHRGSDGSNPWNRVTRAGFRPRLAAENVGTGQGSLEEVIEDWRRSRSHDKNLLLRDATHMGIAVIYDPRTRYRTFWTLVLGSPD